MVFYEVQTIVGIIIFSLPAVIASYLFFIRDKEKTALFFLLTSAFLIRILMISLDPFVHEWDERFHALVARNMMDSPFIPMLFTHHIMDYNYHDWGYNHIWVHKQPLFLWQMALSMKVLGVNTIALRLPSVIMGTILVWLTYDISQKWKMDRRVSFMSAMLVAFAGYALGLTSGWISLDHNDLAFVFYMTCSFWAFTKYIHSVFNVKWALLIGLFAGLAILNKWLTGLLVFGGWGLYLIQNYSKTDWKKYLHLGYSLLVCALVFVPWQVYILHEFPLESSIAFETNRKHMIEDLGHPGSKYFHLNFLGSAYHWILIAFIIPGLIAGLLSKRLDKKLTLSFVAMIIVLFAFFSIMVATKMPAFVYPVSSLMLILIALGIYSTFNKLFDFFKLVPSKGNWMFFFITLGATYI